jgi:hypothetical protein
MSKHPPNHPILAEHIVMRVLQSFYILIYFTSGLSDGDTCPLLGGPSPVGSSAQDHHPTKMAKDLFRASVTLAAHDLRRDRRSHHPVGLRDEGLLTGSAHTKLIA